MSIPVCIRTAGDCLSRITTSRSAVAAENSRPNSMVRSTDSVGTDAFIDDHNQRRRHQSRWCYGKTPMQTSHDTPAKEKLIVVSDVRREDTLHISVVRGGTGSEGFGGGAATFGSLIRDAGH
jgi:hypothetical protein